MEPYIPFVKAIIISTMFWWGTSSVVITDQYILKQNSIGDPGTESEKRSYKIYDLKNNMVHVISNQMETQVVVPIDSLATFFEISKFKAQSGYVVEEKIDTTLIKVNFGGFQCKMEKLKINNSSSRYVIGQEVITYFAKIPWLDTYLDSEDKRKFAGFDRQEYSPYHYIINKSSQNPNQSAKDLILCIIEKSEVDTTLIHTLLNLPLGKE